VEQKKTALSTYLLSWVGGFLLGLDFFGEGFAVAFLAADSFAKTEGSSCT